MKKLVMAAVLAVGTSLVSGASLAEGYSVNGPDSVPYPMREASTKAPRTFSHHAARAARVHHRKAPRSAFLADANGNPVEVVHSGVVRSRKTGATAHVSPKYQAKFQAYIDDLEAHGAKVYYMGGIRRGHCSNASQHPCGAALDVCQDYRGHVSGARDCNLPRPREMAAIASSHGLEEGSVWCNSDYGHAQVHPSAGACSYRRYATGSWGHGTTRVYSARWYHRHHIKVAHR